MESEGSENAVAPRGRFALPGLAWLLAGVCAFAPLAGAVKRWRADDLSWFGGVFAVGIAAAIFLLPLGGAWLVARRRPDRPGWQEGAFYAVLGTLMGGLILSAVLRTADRDATIAAQADAVASGLKRTATGEGGAPGRPTAAPGAANAVNEAIVAAQKATVAHLQAMQLAYENAAAAVAAPGFFDLRPLDSRAAIAAQRAEVETFKQAVRLWREEAELTAYRFSTELRDRQVPEPVVRETVAAYREATEKALPRLRKLREKDAAIGLLLDQFLDFAESELGGWSWRGEVGAEKLAFDRTEAQDRYDELRRTARVLEDERRKLRAEAGR
jgi:hypothetical protein